MYKLFVYREEDHAFCDYREADHAVCVYREKDQAVSMFIERWIKLFMCF